MGHDAPPAIFVCLGVLTLMWPVAMWQVVRFWRRTTTFFDVAPKNTYRHSRVRATPIGIAGGAALLVGGWIVAFDYPTRGSRPDAWQLIAVSAFGLMICALGLTVAVVLVNRPRWAIPPHLRNEPGYLKASRTRARRNLDHAADRG